MSGKTIHNVNEAQSLPTLPVWKDKHMAFDGTKDNFFVKSEWMNCTYGWLFGAHLQVSQINYSIVELELCGVTVETAKLITKQVFPNLNSVNIFDIYVPSFDPLVESALTEKGFNVAKNKWETWQSWVVNPNHVGPNTNDQQNFLAFVNKCAGGWRPNAPVTKEDELRSQVQKLQDEVKVLNGSNSDLLKENQLLREHNQQFEGISSKVNSKVQALEIVINQLNDNETNLKQKIKQQIDKNNEVFDIKLQLLQSEKIVLLEKLNVKDAIIGQKDAELRAKDIENKFLKQQLESTQ